MQGDTRNSIKLLAVFPLCGIARGNFRAAGMNRTPVSAGRILFVAAWLVLASGCSRMPATPKTLITATTFSGLQRDLLARKPDLDQFRLRGPFDVTERDNREIRLSATESVAADLFLSAHADKAPLLIILHGHESSKDLHSYQAAHLASWGIHSIAVQLPNKGPWTANGKTLARLARIIRDRPEIIDGRIDAGKIILAGHSFGGSAVAIALAEGAPAAGGILLDPAAVGRDLPKYLGQVAKPVLLLGADEYYALMRNRDYFFRFIRGGISEISIKDAVHEDAQYPADVGTATEEEQLTFVSAMTAAAFSLSATGNFDYAWTSFGEGSGKNRFFNARKK